MRARAFREMLAFQIKMIKPLLLFTISIVFLFTGVALPYLMIIKLLTPTLLLTFLAYFASIIGFFLGFIGISLYIRFRS